MAAPDKKGGFGNLQMMLAVSVKRTERQLLFALASRCASTATTRSKRLRVTVISLPGSQRCAEGVFTINLRAPPLATKLLHLLRKSESDFALLGKVLITLKHNGPIWWIEHLLLLRGGLPGSWPVLQKNYIDKFPQ